MSLADIVRGAVKLAHDITSAGELQETVTLRRWRSNDADGKPTYATAIQLPAIVDHSARRIRLDGGAETIATATVTFLSPWDALSPAVSGRVEPVDKRDQLTLPTGKSGPILQTKDGLTDPSTSRPYVVQVFLG